MSNQIEILKKRLTLGSLPESAKARIQAQIDQLEAESKGAEESATKQQEKLEKEENKAEADVDDNIEKLKKRLTLGSLPEKAKERIRQQIEDAEKLKSEAKKERAEEKKEAEKKEAEVKAKVKEAVEKVKKVVKEAPKKVSAEKTPAKAKAVEKKVEKEVKKEIEKAKTEVKKAKVEGKKVEAKKAEGAKKRKKKFDKMLTDLQRLINKDKKLKALYGADNPSDLKRDAGRMAKPFGWRYKGEHNYKVPPKSERGNDNTYYEGRPEKADLRRRTYPYLEMGGDVMAKGGVIYLKGGKAITEGSSIKINVLSGALADEPTKYNKYKGKEIVIEEIKPDSTKITKSFVRSTGEKVPFVIDTYTFNIEQYANGGMMAKGGDVGKVQMYYHKTSGGAEYLCSEKVAGTKEGSMKAKYVVRIDGAKRGSEMIIKDGDVETLKMYYHKTSGGAEYLCSEKVAGTKEGSMKAKYVVRIDGAKSGNEMIIKGWEYVGTFGLEEYADGGMMADGGDVGKVQMYYHKTSGGAEYLCSEKVAGTKKEGSMKSKYVVRIDGAKNGSEMSVIKRYLVNDTRKKILKMYYHKTSGGAEYLCSSKVRGTNEGDLKSKYVVRIDGAKRGSEMIIKGWEYVGTFGLEEYADGGMMAQGGEVEEYKVVGWMTEEDRDMGESETLGMYTDKKMAIQIAENAFNRQDYAAVEVLKLTQTGDEDDEVIFFLESGYSEEGEEYKLGGMFGKSRYNTGRSWHLDRARHNKKEDYEIPMPNRKGAKKVSSSKSSAASKSAPKRAKTGKYAKASRSSASASSSSRGYNYIPNSQIKSITTVDDKVITKKKILDGAYVRKKNGGMM
jgi:hypothetical protein